MNDADFARLFDRIGELFSLDLRQYKQQQMRRRLQTFAERHVGGDVDALLAQLNTDRELRRAIRDLLTINVTDFFRDAPQWVTFERDILPRLLRDRSALRIWSAGCSFGQESISIAIALHRLGAFQESRIIATDFDDVALARARAGGPYSVEEMRGKPAVDREEFFIERDGRFTVRPALLARTQFKEMNLLSDPFDDDFDLIVCRNVIIYFEAAPKTLLIRRFRESLRQGGVLFIGATEALFGRDSEGFERLGGNFYMRRAEAARLSA
jgi:chemotaxis protein methyltransferase CheR